MPAAAHPFAELRLRITNHSGPDLEPGGADAAAPPLVQELATDRKQVRNILYREHTTRHEPKPSRSRLVTNRWMCNVDAVADHAEHTSLSSPAQPHALTQRVGPIMCRLTTRPRACQSSRINHLACLETAPEPKPGESLRQSKL